MHIYNHGMDMEHGENYTKPLYPFVSPSFLLRLRLIHRNLLAGTVQLVSHFDRSNTVLSISFRNDPAIVQTSLMQMKKKSV